jgi:hypothetical protein
MDKALREHLKREISRIQAEKVERHARATRSLDQDLERWTRESNKGKDNKALAERT